MSYDYDDLQDYINDLESENKKLKLHFDNCNSDKIIQAKQDTADMEAWGKEQWALSVTRGERIDRLREILMQYSNYFLHHKDCNGIFACCGKLAAFTLKRDEEKK